MTREESNMWRYVRKSLIYLTMGLAATAVAFGLGCGRKVENHTKNPRGFEIEQLSQTWIMLARYPALH